jgi:hypothetical protein
MANTLRHSDMITVERLANSFNGRAKLMASLLQASNDEPVIVFINNGEKFHAVADYKPSWSELGRYNSFSAAKNIISVLQLKSYKICYLSTGEEVQEH